MSNMIIFGAGASHGSDIFNVPPLASGLIEELISFQPHTWGKIQPSLISLLKQDFEKGMIKLSQENPHSIATLHRSMAEFFFRYAPGPDNLYRKLARRIRQYGWSGVLTSFNYERLLEQSLIFEGLKPVLGKPKTPNQIETCFPHGCCHLFCETTVDSSPANPFNKTAIRNKGALQSVSNPDGFREHISNDALAPVIDYFEPVKIAHSGAK